MALLEFEMIKGSRSSLVVRHSPAKGCLPVLFSKLVLVVVILLFVEFASRTAAASALPHLASTTAPADIGGGGAAGSSTLSTPATTITTMKTTNYDNLEEWLAKATFVLPPFSKEFNISSSERGNFTLGNTSCSSLNITSLQASTTTPSLQELEVQLLMALDFANCSSTLTLEELSVLSPLSDEGSSRASPFASSLNPQKTKNTTYGPVGVSFHLEDFMVDISVTLVVDGQTGMLESVLAKHCNSRVNVSGFNLTDKNAFIQSLLEKLDPVVQAGINDVGGIVVCGLADLLIFDLLPPIINATNREVTRAMNASAPSQVPPPPGVLSLDNDVFYFIDSFMRHTIGPHLNSLVNIFTNNTACIKFQEQNTSTPQGDLEALAFKLIEFELPLDLGYGLDLDGLPKTQFSVEIVDFQVCGLDSFNQSIVPIDSINNSTLGISLELYNLSVSAVVVATGSPGGNSSSFHGAGMQGTLQEILAIQMRPTDLQVSLQLVLWLNESCFDGILRVPSDCLLQCFDLVNISFFKLSWDESTPIQIQFQTTGELETELNEMLGVLIPALTNEFQRVLPYFLEAVLVDPLIEAANVYLAEQLAAVHEGNCSSRIANSTLPVHSSRSLPLTSVIGFTVVVVLYPLFISLACCFAYRRSQRYKVRQGALTINSSTSEISGGRSSKFSEPFVPTERHTRPNPRGIDRRSSVSSSSEATPLLIDENKRAVSMEDQGLNKCVGNFYFDMDADDEEEDRENEKGKGASSKTKKSRVYQPSILFSPVLPLWVRCLIPFLLFVNVGFFISSGTTNAAVVSISQTIGNHTTVELPSIFELSLVGTIHDMWEAKIYPLSILVLLLSGIWPYVKLAVMMYCWIAAPHILSEERRNFFLHYVDVLGKWSLMDNFLPIFMIVGLHLNIPTQQSTTSIIITPHYGYYFFVLSTVMSLIIGHIVLALHRKVSGHEFDVVQVLWLQTPFWRAVKAAFILAVAGLMVYGVLLPSFEVHVKGAAGLLLQWVNISDVHDYSLVQVGLNFPSNTPNPDSFEIRFIQFAYFLFAMVIPMIHLCVLFVQNFRPWDPVLHHISDTLNAWSALEVLMLSITASLIEIRQFAIFVIGDRCNGIDRFLEKYFIKDLDNDDRCFDVVSELSYGCWVLFAVSVCHAIIRNIVAL